METKIEFLVIEVAFILQQYLGTSSCSQLVGPLFILQYSRRSQTYAKSLMELSLIEKQLKAGIGNLCRLT